MPRILQVWSFSNPGGLTFTLYRCPESALEVQSRGLDSRRGQPPQPPAAAASSGQQVSPAHHKFWGLTVSADSLLWQHGGKTPCQSYKYISTVTFLPSSHHLVPAGRPGSQQGEVRVLPPTLYLTLGCGGCSLYLLTLYLLQSSLPLKVTLLLLHPTINNPL